MEEDCDINRLSVRLNNYGLDGVTFPLTVQGKEGANTLYRATNGPQSVISHLHSEQCGK